MKQLTEKVVSNTRNAWGGYANVAHQEFEVEANDIGQVKENYLGYRHKSYKFAPSDLGRIIDVMSDGTTWSC